MQDDSTRRSNRARSAATRSALIAAARQLFIERGYAETGTPEIVRAAAVTRGALYHHFKDKADLFYAVAGEAAAEVAREIERGSRRSSSALDALIRGADAYFAAMAENGRARLLLLEAPAILSPEQVGQLSDTAGSSELRAGLERALPDASRSGVSIDALTDVVSAAFDRAALAIAHGGPARPYKSALQALLKGLVDG